MCWSPSKNEEHRVWTSSGTLPKSVHLVSLADLLTTFTGGSIPNRKSRLILGLKLVSSVLQLNATRWLTVVWEARDILFPKIDLRNADHQILSRPFVHPHLNKISAADPKTQQQSSNEDIARSVTGLGGNLSLYSLGIVLLEIWHWQTFSSLHSSSASEIPEILFACELSEKLFDDAGERYSIAVRRCIRGLDLQGTDLEEDSFRKRVYQDIWEPLESNLKAFSGSDCIQEIIGED